MKKIVLVVLLVIFLGLAFYLVNRYFLIKNITCRNQYGFCSQQLSKKLDELEGQSYLSLKSAAGDVIEADPSVKSYTTQLKLPDSLEVNVVEEKVNFALKTDDDLFILVSKKGEVLEIVDKSNLPFVLIENFSGSVGGDVSSEQLFALSLIEELFFAYGISNGELSREAIEITQDDGIKVLFPTTGDIQILLGSYEIINSRLKVTRKDPKIDEVDGISRIDLRYNNPVIK